MAASVRTTTISPRAAPTAGVYDSADIVVASGDGIFVDIWYFYEWGTADALSSLVWDAPTANETITVLQSQTMTANARFATAYLPAPTAKTGKIRATFAGTVNDACWMRVRRRPESMAMWRASPTATQHLPLTMRVVVYG